MPGVYISFPFCSQKCTYCNFASGVYGPERMDAYVARLCAEIAEARGFAGRAGGELPAEVDSVFFGGGTPSLLSAVQMLAVFEALRREFTLAEGGEITVECAPGQLGEETLDELLRQGLNRVSFGVQSFIDREAQAVGRSHTRALCLEEIARMRAAGIANLNVDLIAGLPHQTARSWRESVETAIETGVPHVSVYMLEVDEESRLGREMLGEGRRYGACAAPPEERVAEWYGAACEWLEAEGVAQYEISNFARAGRASRHNVKYWRREPYLGFGLDAHSMLRAGGAEAVRWANGAELEEYLDGGDTRPDSSGVLPLLRRKAEVQRIGPAEGFEEALFLELRMNAGVDLAALRAEFGASRVEAVLAGLRDPEEARLVEVRHDRVRLTGRGRLVSNEVFERVLVGV